MSNASFSVPPAVNEPIKSYAGGTPERSALKAEMLAMQGREVEVPVIIGGKEIHTGQLGKAVCPHDHRHVLATFHQGTGEHVDAAAKVCREAAHDWAAMPWEHRAAIFLKAADLLAGSWRQVLNGSTMLGQSKNAFQAEIDAACELVDFWRFNVQFMRELYAEQPLSSPGCWNRVEQRPLEGFVFAVTPFNFTSIAGNLPTAPATHAGTRWCGSRPRRLGVLAATRSWSCSTAAGLPPGVINMVPGSGAEDGRPGARAPRISPASTSPGATGGVQRDVGLRSGTNIGSYKLRTRGSSARRAGRTSCSRTSSADAESLAYNARCAARSSTKGRSAPPRVPRLHSATTSGPSGRASASPTP